ncbi:hypothetical protein LIER_13868 [Lithospermum erythrorhizon]|uniref:Uncharacterized protein n=1 Tax=Lithospermum erythrorhizon TaxID=34254 RepID=A0AAV3PWZ5_LITER
MVEIMNLEDGFLEVLEEIPPNVMKRQCGGRHGTVAWRSGHPTPQRRVRRTTTCGGLVGAPWLALWAWCGDPP